MNFKKLRVNATSIALALTLSSGAGLVLAQPVYAAEVVPEETTIEQPLEENKVEEKVVEEKQEVKEVVAEEKQEEQKEEVVEEKQEEVTEKKQEVVEEQKEEATEEKQEVVEENKEEVIESKKEEVVNPETKTEEVKEDVVKEEATEEATTTNEATAPTREGTTTSQSNEQHKVTVVTNKVDENGNPLVGATLQIVDKDGNVIDEWVSDGTPHTSMVPEGDYILKEVGAPEGYIAAADQDFNVKVEVKDINADVEHDDSHDVCWHYGGVALYYIESEGIRDEVYCINQDWDEPHGISYNGLVLDANNIRTFTPDSDVSMTNDELYDKVLDIIYHRSTAEELFPELSETEIRFITEYALKTYTSAEVTTKQAMRDENGNIMRDEDGNIIYEDIRFLRYYRYAPDTREGYVIDPNNGDGLGKLAQHWWTAHGHTKIPAEYAALFYYLINGEEKHPDDMFLYIYSTKNPTADGESYQNLLGVRWFNPYDDEYQTYLTVVNEKEVTPPTPPTPPEPPTPDIPDIPDEPVVPVKPDVPVKPVVHNTTTKVSTTPQTGDETNLYIPALACLGSSLTLLGMTLARRKEKEKVK